MLVPKVKPAMVVPQVVPQVVPAMKAAPADPKAALMQLCQKRAKRPMLKMDVEYTVAQYGAQFQATVKLNCFNGESYAGQLEKNGKDAEKSAAQHAMADLDPTYKIVPLASLAPAAPAAGTIAPAGGAPLTNSDPKSDLNQFCQRSTKRPIAKGDIMYTTAQHGAQFQSTVCLKCMDGQEYAGELCSNTKEAEKSAAEQALQAHAAEIAALPMKRKAPKAGVAGEMDAPAAKKIKTDVDPATASITPKSQLNVLAMRLLKRSMNKGDTVYESLQVEGGYQATVALPSLPGDYGGVAWAGQVCATKQLAEQSAAEEAYNQLTSDPNVKVEPSVPKPKPQKGKGEKGCGKGKDAMKGCGKGKMMGMGPMGMMGMGPMGMMDPMGMMGMGPMGMMW